MSFKPIRDYMYDHFGNKAYYEIDTPFSIMIAKPHLIDHIEKLAKTKTARVRMVGDEFYIYNQGYKCICVEPNSPKLKLCITCETDKLAEMLDKFVGDKPHSLYSLSEGKLMRVDVYE